MEKKKYLTIRQIAERLGDAKKFYCRVRRKVIKAYRSGRFGNLIINVTSGKTNMGLLVEESIMFEVLAWV